MGDFKIVPIRSKEDYEAALARIDELVDADPGTPEFEELDVLSDLVELYEGKNVRLPYPSPLGAIEFCMEQRDLKPRDLVPFLGSAAKVTEILQGKRAITMPMARALHKHLGIPAEVLLQETSEAQTNDQETLVWERFPLKSMAKAGWIQIRPNLKKHAEEVIRDLIDRAGETNTTNIGTLFRKNDYARTNAKMDHYALRAWCWQLLATVNENPLATTYARGTVTLNLLKQVASLSRAEEGPLHAQAFLAERGIALVTLKHLPRTYLDGAVIRRADGTPVVGLTLRYDRIDNFWFCLMHELAHIGRHLDTDTGDAFVDDMSLRNIEGIQEDPREKEADEWAEEALVPKEHWEASAASVNPTTTTVLNLASAIGRHPAIVAGKVRHERNNYRLLSHFVGMGEVRRLFEPSST